MTTPQHDQIPALLQQAFNYFQAGQLAEAEAEYLQVLLLSPNHPDALYSLAALAFNAGAIDQALMYFQSLLAVKPSASVYLDIGNLLLMQHKIAEAAGHFQQAIQLQPTLVEAHIALGDLYLGVNQLQQAVACFQQVLVLDPKRAAIYCKLGCVHFALAELDDALDCLDRAIQLQPDYAEAWLNRGVVHHAQGLIHDAAADATEAVRCNPESIDALLNQAWLFRQLKKFPEATSAYQHVIALQPDHAVAYSGLGNICAELRQYDSAIQYFHQATSHRPDFVDAYCDWADVFYAQNQYEAAAAKYQQAIDLKPDFVRAHFHLGLVLLDQEKHQQALDQLQRTLKIQPDLTIAHIKLAATLHELGRYSEERAAYRRALELDKTSMMAHSGLLFALNDDPECSPVDYLRQAQYFGDVAQAQAQPFIDWPLLPQSGERLRVGFVSGDMRTHPVGYFLENVLNELDSTRFELFAYNIYPLEDELTARIKPLFTEWRELYMLQVDDATAAKTIRDDGIHILVDLGGHTRFNRLPMFAWKPAPVQVSWLGYGASTALPSMDYVLVDAISVPEHHHQYFTESLSYLPETRLCFTPPKAADGLAVSELPALENGYITFGCFQNLRKLNDAVLALWGRVLAALPTAHLLIKNKQIEDEATRRLFRQRLLAAKIPLDRVTMEGQSTYREYLEAYADVDLLLDTFPFSGGTTTCEALWMGVPTLTLAGDRLIGRQGASFMTCVGLPDWVADSVEDYVAKAVAHASDVNQLASLRAELRQRMAASPLVNAAQFARHLEHAFAVMWQQRRESLKL